MGDFSLKIFLDIDSDEKIKQVGLELQTTKSAVEDYARVFADALLDLKAFEAKSLSERKLLQALSQEDRKELQHLYPLINPFFLALDSLLKAYSGEKTGIRALEEKTFDLLCRCEKISKNEFKTELKLNRYLLKKAFQKLNLASSCGACYQDAIAIYESSLEESYFLEGFSYVDWVLKIDALLKEYFLKNVEFNDYHFEIVSFEKLLLKVKVQRGETRLARPELTKILQAYLQEFSNKEIKLSIIF